MSRMENVAQAMLGMNSPSLSFQKEMEIAATALTELSPDTLRCVVQTLLFIGQRVAIDVPTALKQSTDMVTDAISLSPPERTAYWQKLSQILFQPGENYES